MKLENTANHAEMEDWTVKVLDTEVTSMTIFPMGFQEIFTEQIAGQEESRH